MLKKNKPLPLANLISVVALKRLYRKDANYLKKYYPPVATKTIHKIA